MIHRADINLYKAKASGRNKNGMLSFPQTLRMTQYTDHSFDPA
jgi:hypothetical protein